MANYNLYNNINPSSITSATGSLRNSLNEPKNKIKSFPTSLNDQIWKAKSKETLLTAFKKIDSEVYPEVENALSNLDTAAGYISKYKEARKQAIQLKSRISNAKEDEDTSSLVSELASQERIMEECESNVNSLL